MIGSITSHAGQAKETPISMADRGLNAGFIGLNAVFCLKSIHYVPHGTDKLVVFK